MTFVKCRQVNIAETECDLQRIVYRFHTHDELIHFRLNTVTYGTASASFLAVRTLHELAFQNYSNLPEECRTILQDFYMDDLITGSDTIEHTIHTKQRITQILKDGFQLRKFMSNDKRILDKTHFDHEISDYQIAEGHVRPLGLA